MAAPKSADHISFLFVKLTKMPFHRTRKRGNRIIRGFIAARKSDIFKLFRSSALRENLPNSISSGHQLCKKIRQIRSLQDINFARKSAKFDLLKTSALQEKPPNSISSGHQLCKKIRQIPSPQDINFARKAAAV